MAWTETSATAWGSIDIKIGTPGLANIMSADLASLGNIKENSFSVETEDGTKLQWFATGHNLIDELRLQSTITIKCSIKNLNLSTLSKFWSVTDDTSGIKVMSMTTSAKFSVQIGSPVVGSEVLEIPYASVYMKATYAEDSGYGQDVEFTVIRGSKTAPLFTIKKVV